MTTETDTTLGRAFAEALSRKDFDELAGEILHPELDFMGLTPRRTWQASNAQEAVDEILSSWFEPSDEIEELVEFDSDAVSDRQRIRYRFLGRNEAGPFLVEQQAYYTERDGRIGWMRVLCSGFRPT